MAAALENDRRAVRFHALDALAHVKPTRYREGKCISGEMNYLSDNIQIKVR